MKNGVVAFFNQHRNRPPFARCAASRPSSSRPSPHFLAPKAAFPAAGSRTFTSPKGHDGLAKAILSARKSTAMANSTSRFRTLKAINLLTINELRKTRNPAVFPLKLLSPSEKPHFSGLICQENSLFSVQINHQKKTVSTLPTTIDLRAKSHDESKKDQDLRPRCLHHRPGRVARFARTPALQKDQPPRR